MSPLKKPAKKGMVKNALTPAAANRTRQKAGKIPKAPVKKKPARIRPSTLKPPASTIEQAAFDRPEVRTSKIQKKKKSTPQPQDHYRMIFDETDMGYVELDLAGDFTYVNEVQARNGGYKPSDIMGKNFRSFMDKPTLKKLTAVYQGIYKTGQPVRGVEAEFLHQDGSRRIAEISANLLRDEKGRPAGFRVLAKDVTERRQAESELRLSEARLQSLSDITQYSARDITDFLDHALDHAIRLTGSEIGYIFYYNQDAKQFTLNTWSRNVMQQCQITKPQTVYDLDKTGIWGEAVRQRKPILINNYPAPNPLKKGYPEGHVHLRRFLTIPVFSDDKIIAVVGVANKQTDYNEFDIRQLTLLMDAVWTISERKRMERELLKKEEGYRTILEAIEEGYCEMDLTGNITFVNHAGARIIGYTPEEMIGANFRQYVSRAALEELLDRFKTIYKTRRPIKRFEMEYINKDGIRRFLEVSGALIFDNDGNPSGFRGLAHDVTQSKWTEEALLQSEAKYFSIVESIGHAYFETDLRGYLTFFNDRLSSDLGYSRSELLSMSHRDLQDAENGKKTFEAFNRVYQTGQPDPAFIYEANCKDGSKAVFELSVSLMRDAEGGPIGFRGLSRDITERRKIEKALKASEERAITIIATIPDPYFEANLERHFTYVNNAFLSLVGYNLDELSQMHYEDFLEEKASEQVLNLFNPVHTTGMTMKNVEIEIKNHSGEKRIVNLSLSLIRNPLDEPTGFHGIMRDVTAKKEAEAMILESSAKLIEYSESLELSVSERTAELEKAKVAAEAASRAKSDFLANISHEFQTPLNSIVGFTKVLKDRLFGDLNPKQEEFVRYISEAGATLSKLLNEIIDVSSVSTGRTLLNLTTVSLPKALTQAVSLLNRQIQEKSHTVTVDVALEADVRLEGDEEKIRQIFFQLLSNAVKYTPAGGKIIVDAQRAGGKAGEDGVKVAIKDNGPGIRPEDIPRLFQNFGRLESAYTRESSGVGVGLALTRQLVELHGGDIQVESEYGRGSAFSVFLPLKQKRPDIPE